MAVFRIEKTENYTVMSNHHLRNTDLSLKAKGLLSQMLSLPENWDYTLAGLSHINLESIDAIRTAVWELEKAGYIVRQQGRDGKGKMTAIEYIIYEQPQGQECPVLENPTSEKPLLDCPTSGNPTQINKEYKVNKKGKNINLSNKESIPFHSTREPERKGTEAKNTKAIAIYRDIIVKNLDYDIMIERYPYDKERIDGIVDLVLEIVCTARKTIRIVGDDYPAEFVKAKFLKLNGGHLEFVLDCMKNNTTEIRNIKKYLLAALFNALSTIDSYYTALVAHDMADKFT